MDLERIFRFYLNWQIRKKVNRMKDLVETHYSENRDYNRDSIKPISGTFIYGTPPDYEGVKAMRWTSEEWEIEFRRLKKLGIDTAIVQSTVIEDTQENLWIYYPISDSTLSEITSINQRVKTTPIMEPQLITAILDAAEKTQMKIHMGLFFPIKGWFGTSSSKLVQQIQVEEIAIARDLVRLYGKHPALAGWYISPEIIYPLQGKKLNLDMNTFLKGITKILKSATPNLPIGISPGSNIPEGDSKPLLDFWTKTLQDSGIDLLYPMDAIGQLVNYPDKIAEFWKFCRGIAEKTNVKLWANCESFERKNFNNPNPFEAASFQRLLWQLATVTPYVEKIVSWECMFFLNGKGAAGGDKLEKEYRKFFLE